MPLVFGVASDFQNVVLTAPAGTVFTEVLFASYGTSPNYYSLGGCHLAGSLTRAQQLIVGQTGTVTIYVSPGNLGGDPCFGVVKNFRVVARYLPATTSLAFSTIRNNFFNTSNDYNGVTNYGTNDADLYNMNYYRGKMHRNSGNAYVFPSGTISFSNFYNADGNCVCVCACDCACSTDSSCFPGDALVTMADGTTKRIDEIKIGDVVDGGFGYKNKVEAYHSVNIGTGHMYIINNKHRTTIEHKHWTTEGWAAIDTTAATNRTSLTVTVDNNGTKEKRSNTKLSRTKTSQLKVGMTLITPTGPELIESIERDWSIPPDTIVYTLITDGSHTHICNGYIVGGWARDIDFDYEQWKPI